MARSQPRCEVKSYDELKAEMEAIQQQVAQILITNYSKNTPIMDDQI